MPVGKCKTNICFDCKKAVCGCSWSRNFTPVDGWTAEPTSTTYALKSGELRAINGYHITACPEFEPEETGTISPPGKPLRVHCETTGEFFRSASAAAAAYGVSKTTIVKACNGDMNFRGMVWQYV